MLKRMLNIKGLGERGDAPAQAILQANSRAQAIRKAAETQEELTKIRDRVTRTLDTYDLSEKLSAGADKAEVDRITEEFIRQQATLEFVDDMTQLVVILGDPVAKRKYQQQVTVFIVGFENLCGRRAKLLAQLQEFFVQNSLDDDKFVLDPPEFDLDSVGEQVREALEKAESATARLATVSKDVMKALELANPKETKKGKKKLEKSIQQSHQDIMSLTEKLLKVQNDLDENENKLTQTYKSMEMKTVEIERLKVQAENGKKAADLASELKAELGLKDQELQTNLKEINNMELSVAQLEDKQERDFERQKKIKEENERAKEEYEKKIKDLQDYVESTRTEMQQHYDSELKKLQHDHEMTLYYLRQDHETALKRKERVIETAKKKNEDLKAELSASDSSKRNSLTTGSPLSKRGSLFSPDLTSEGEGGPASRLSLKSSAQSVRMMLSKSGTENEGTPSSSPLSRQATKDSPAQTASAESGAESRTESVKSEKAKSDLKDRKSKTPEVKSGRKSKSPQKMRVKVKTPEEQEAEEKAKATQESKTPQGDQEVEKAEASVQSDAEELEDLGEQTRPLIPRTSTLTALPEIDGENDIEDDGIDWATLSPEDLLATAELYKAKSNAKRGKLETDLADWKTRYLKKTDSLRKDLANAQGKFAEEKEDLLSKMNEAEMLKVQAEQEAEQAVLQLEDVLAEQEEMRQLQEKALADKNEEMTMTGLSLTGKESPEKFERDTMTGMSLDSKQALQSDSHHSFMSRGVSPFPIIESSTQEDTVGEEQAETRGISPRDSGFEGAGSSIKFDSRPVSGTSNVNVLSPKVEVEEDQSQTTPNEPVPVSRSSTLTAPRRELVMSARARRRLVSSALRDHPVASESLRTYDAVLKFKDNVTRWLDKQGVVDGAEELRGLDMAAVNRDDLAQVIERLPEIRYCIGQVLETVDDILSSQSLSRETTFDVPPIRTEGESTFQESTEGEIVRGTLSEPRGTAEGAELSESPIDRPTHDKGDIQSSYVKLLKEYNDLAEGYESMRRHMDEETKFHQEQTSQNAAVMADMQETINQLKLQLVDALAGRSASPGRASSSIMFSRLDAERNAKILKRALNERRVREENVSDVIGHMSEYVSLPAKRLAHIVRRYSHHRAMQEIEEDLKKNSTNLNDNVLHTLERMEVLQNERAKRWGDQMDEMADMRERLAQLMMETFQRLENDTGIFLIKPVLSYQGRSDPLGGYMVSKKKPPTYYQPPNNTNNPATPAPTPWMSKQSKSTTSMGGVQRELSRSSIKPCTQLEDGVMDMDVTRASRDGNMIYQGPAWQVSRSQVQGSVSTPTTVPITTPKILELDVNRMMLGQTQVSTGFISASGEKGEVPSSLVRTYVTVERPSGSKQIKKAKRPSSTDTSSVNFQSPPGSPYDPMVPRVQSSPSNFRQYSPLPPIRMPDLRQYSRSSKSARSYPESEAVTIPGSPDAAERYSEGSPSRQENGEVGRISLSPDVVPVR